MVLVLVALSRRFNPPVVITDDAMLEVLHRAARASLDMSFSCVLQKAVDHVPKPSGISSRAKRKMICDFEKKNLLSQSSRSIFPN